MRAKALVVICNNSLCHQSTQYAYPLVWFHIRCGSRCLLYRLFSSNNHSTIATKPVYRLSLLIGRSRFLSQLPLRIQISYILPFVSIAVLQLILNDGRKKRLSPLIRNISGSNNAKAPPTSKLINPSYCRVYRQEQEAQTIICHNSLCHRKTHSRGSISPPVRIYTGCFIKHSYYPQQTRLSALLLLGRVPSLSFSITTHTASRIVSPLSLVSTSI